MERHFLRIADERTNVANSNEKLLVCSDYTVGGKPLSLFESPAGGGGYSQKNWVGLCGLLSKLLPYL